MAIHKFILKNVLTLNVAIVQGHVISAIGHATKALQQEDLGKIQRIFILFELIKIKQPQTLLILLLFKTV